DDELVPIRGQLTVCIPQPEVRYRASGRLPNSTINASISPRSDGLVIGNMQERGNWSLEPNEEVRQQNMSAAIAFFAGMHAPTGGARVTRSEPHRSAASLESFYGEEP